MRKRSVFQVSLFAVAFGIIASCSTTTAQLKNDAGATQDFLVDENYQSVYRRIASLARCTDGAWAGVFASYQTDAQLYPELGMGEVSHRLNNIGINNYYWHVEVRKEEEKARVKIFAGNTLANDAAITNLAALARGDLQPDC